MSSPSKKLILVIGATGAQGVAVIDALLATGKNEEPSPYAVRALTRDLNSKQAQELTARGVECVKGSFEDFSVVREALQGCYGAWVNTDGFTVGERREMFASIRIFELAKEVGTLRHFVYSSLDYSFKKGNYKPEYRVEHYDGKARVADWMKAQPSDTNDSGMTWSAVATGPYMELLTFAMGPFNKRPDGTYVFASPVGDGHVPLITLSDLGYFARYSFDNRQEVSGKELEVVSEMVGWDHLVKTFTRVTGENAIYKRQTMDEWLRNFVNVDQPVAIEGSEGDTTFRKNFTAFWRMFHDDIITRDIDWIRRVNPHGHTLESWMRATNYTGQLNPHFLKNQQVEDNRRLGINWKVVETL